MNWVPLASSINNIHKQVHKTLATKNEKTTKQKLETWGGQ